MSNKEDPNGETESVEVQQVPGPKGLTKAQILAAAEVARRKLVAQHRRINKGQ